MSEDFITSKDIAVVADESRHHPRKKTEHIIQVTNAMTGEIIGRIGNLSLEGMMLILHHKVRENALFQLIISLPNPPDQAYKLEVGVREQWSEEAHVPGQFWSGFHIIDISPDDYNKLANWVKGRQEESRV